MLYRATIYLNRQHMTQLIPVAKAQGLKPAQLVRLLVAQELRRAAEK
jgi:hypothetical protein